MIVNFSALQYKMDIKIAALASVLLLSAVADGMKPFRGERLEKKQWIVMVDKEGDTVRRMEFDAYTGQLKELRDQIDQRDRYIQQLKQTLEKKDTEFNLAMAICNGQRSQLQESTRQNQALYYQNQCLNQQNCCLSAQVQALTEQSQDQQKKIEDQRTHLRVLNRKLSGANSKPAKKEEEDISIDYTPFSNW